MRHGAMIWRCKKKNLRLAVERAGMDWAEAEAWLGRDDWKDMVALSQHEMVEHGLMGRAELSLSGPDGEPDLGLGGNMVDRRRD